VAQVLKGDMEMIPANRKTDPFLISKIREKDMESILDWFEQHQKSFYAMGALYLRDQKQVEELFYRAIRKIHRELPNYKRKSSFDMWASTIFIQECLGLSDAVQPVQPVQDVFDSLQELSAKDKEAIGVIYLMKHSIEEAAQILNVDIGEIRERLFSGIEFLKTELGYHGILNGCPEYKRHYIDYLEKNLERTQKVEFEIHTYNCHGCQEELASFQDIMLTLKGTADEVSVPAGILMNVKARIEQEENIRQKKRKKRKKIGMSFAAVFTLLLCTGFVTGTFNSLYYSWTEDNEELRAYLQNDLGERLELEAESDGVKIRIKSVVADDVQTLVFYEIEDTAKDNRYMLNLHDGVNVENEYEIMDRSAQQRFSPPVPPADFDKNEKNIFEGKLSLLPLKDKSGTIKLNINRLQKLKVDPENPGKINPWAYEEMEFADGKWKFEIPVKKNPSNEYSLDQETEIEGMPVRFDKLTIAPTTTILQYSFKNLDDEKRIEMLNFELLQAGQEKLKADIYGSSYVDIPGSMEWNAFQAHFAPLFGQQPEEVKVKFGSIHLAVQDEKSIELESSKPYPQTFDYLGSTISIDKVEVGSPTKVVISNHDLVNREYESIQFHVTGKEEYENISMGMDSEGVLVDKFGKEYDPMELGYPFEEIEQPRYFQTVQSFELSNDTSGDEVVPKTLDIQGYTTTKYLDEMVKIEL
jgi:DNA-directed RNA polymerase specialized sigma24 family protein